MKTIKIFAIATLILFALYACKKDDSNNINTGNNTQYSWTQISSFPGVARDEAVAFVVNNLGYVGLGTDWPDMYQDFYKYDPASDTWMQLSDFAGVARRGAIAFVIGDQAFVGLGYGDRSKWGNLKDFWKYDAANDSWVQLNNFPNNDSEDVSCFVIDSKAYIVVGGWSEIYEYDPLNDTWTEKADFPGEGREDAVAFSISSKGYFGTGYEDNDGKRFKDFWEFDPSADTWTKKADFPGSARNNAIGFSISNYGFVGTGNNFYGEFDDFWRYDPTKDSWIQVESYSPGLAEGLVSFVIGDIAYVGTGYIGSKSTTADKKWFYKFESK